MKVFVMIEDKTKIVVGVFANKKAAEKAAESFPRDVYIEDHNITDVEPQKEFTSDQLGDMTSKCGYKTFSD